MQIKTFSDNDQKKQLLLQKNVILFYFIFNHFQNYFPMKHKRVKSLLTYAEDIVLA